MAYHIITKSDHLQVSEFRTHNKKCAIGKYDSDKRLNFNFMQEKGPYGFWVLITKFEEYPCTENKT